ncbi:MAG: flagellar protein FlgN [Curvibacter lanceolatus]|jgi:flagella synthesis protein FlgN|uniref:flagellar protein FlgN n=1 Tax=Curvibacter lanceolatus TaxID=86182 RepID=UPI00235626A6|nr:flagellar protein FlgN [Curvibacter lanceolatus]MBV5293592.1 flagellar protein FlgN [Curvibacter lanceolatus]
MNNPTRGSATPLPPLKQLMQDLQTDLREYQALHQLLEAQFQAALRHDASALQAQAAEVTTLVDRLDQRRQARRELLRTLLPVHPAPGVAELLALLPAQGPMRANAARGWAQLEALVRACKERNARNGRLMADQQAVFQRVLHGEENPLYGSDF